MFLWAFFWVQPPEIVEGMPTIYKVELETPLRARNIMKKSLLHKSVPRISSRSSAVMSSLSQTAITRFPQPLMQVRCALHCSSSNEHQKHSVLSDSFSVSRTCFYASVPGWLADHPDASSWAPRGVLTAEPCIYLRSELQIQFAESSKSPEAPSIE